MSACTKRTIISFSEAVVKLLNKYQISEIKPDGAADGQKFNEIVPDRKRINFKETNKYLVLETVWWNYPDTNTEPIHTIATDTKLIGLYPIRSKKVVLDWSEEYDKGEAAFLRDPETGDNNTAYANYEDTSNYCIKINWGHTNRTRLISIWYDIPGDNDDNEMFRMKFDIITRSLEPENWTEFDNVKLFKRKADDHHSRYLWNIIYQDRIVHLIVQTLLENVKNGLVDEGDLPDNCYTHSYIININLKGNPDNIPDLTEKVQDAYKWFRTNWWRFFSLVSWPRHAGIGADPYIRTLAGDFYKMSNFQGNSRMLQGSYKDKLLTINAYTRFSTEKEREYTRQYIETQMDLYEAMNPGTISTLRNTDYFDKDNTYISKTHIQWGDQYITADMDNLIILENTTDLMITYSSDEPDMLKDTMVQMPDMEHYKSETEKAIRISFPGQLELILAYSENPQVRGSYKVKNGHLINMPQGALVHKMYEKDIRVRKLNDLKALKWSGDRHEPKSVTREKYVNKQGDICSKLIPVY